MLRHLEENKLRLTTCAVALAGILLLVSYLKTPSPTTASGAPRPSGSRDVFQKNTTFRLQGIPALLHGHSVSEIQVINLLKKAWKIDDSVTVTIHSLASDPLDDSRKVATLSFQELPQFISPSERRWTETIPGGYEGPVVLTLDVEFFGLTPLHHESDANCTLDVVALSGLNGHAFGSFKQRGDNSFMWLRDTLPQYLTEAGIRTRVFIYGYDSQLISSDSFQEVTDLGREFKNKMVQLTQNRTESGMNQLIMLGHSLGGIIVKQALISLARGTSSVYEERTLQRVTGLMFFGTPSHGMDIETLLPIVGGQPNEFFLRSLGPSTSVLRDQMDDFRRLFERKDFAAFWYYETKESPTAQQASDGEWRMTGPKRRLVDIFSATNGMPHDYGRHVVRSINRNHSEMVKLQGPADEAFKQVFADLKLITATPPLATLYSLTREQNDFLQSLDFARQDSRRDNIERATDQTCDWFFDSEEFINWINATSLKRPVGLLWVKGNPGVGKSTLMREALRRTRNFVSQWSTSIISFFFNARGERLEQTTQGLYRSLLHQILRSDLKALDLLLPDFLERSLGKVPDNVEWEEEVVKDYLLRACQGGISKPVIVFIDALDECTTPEISRMVEFFKRLVDEPQGTNAGLRVCISSRHCPHPPTFGYPELIVENHNKDDIYTYIKTELENYQTLLELQDDIFERSSGVFLWVRIVIGELRNEEDMCPGRPISILKRKLKDTPSELENLFGGLLEKLDPKNHAQATFMFQLVLFAGRPLELEEVTVAMSFHPEAHFQTREEVAQCCESIDGLQSLLATIITLSGGLLEVVAYDVDSDEDEGILRTECQFIHESARDYFLNLSGFQKLSVVQDHASIPGWCHSTIAEVSVNYLREGPFSAFVHICKNALDYRRHFRAKANDAWMNKLIEFPFLHYVASYICEHIEIAEDAGISQETSLRYLIQMDSDAKTCLYNSGRKSDLDPESTQFFECCAQGVERIKTATRLIKMEVNPCLMINEKNPWSSDYPLTVACKNPHSAPLVELLLQNGAEVDVDSGGKSVLLLALQHNNFDAIQTLISYGADVRSRSSLGAETALHLAVKSKEIFEVLMLSGAAPDAKDGHGWTPLITAGFHGYFELFPLLINAGADVNYKSLTGETALHKALRALAESESIELTPEVFEAVYCCISNGLDVGTWDLRGNTLWSLWVKTKGKIDSDANHKRWDEIEEILRHAYY